MNSTRCLLLIDSGLVGSTDFHGRDAARAEDAQGIPTQRRISPRILVYEEKQTGGYIARFTKGILYQESYKAVYKRDLVPGGGCTIDVCTL